MSVVAFDDRVDRCNRCNTFVKKGAKHTLEECDRRIYNKKNRSSSSSSGARKRRYRLTPKRESTMRSIIRLAYNSDSKRKAACRKLGLSV